MTGLLGLPFTIIILCACCGHGKIGSTLAQQPGSNCHKARYVSIWFLAYYPEDVIVDSRYVYHEGMVRRQERAVR